MCRRTAALLLCLGALVHAAALGGIVTDPSGAAVLAAVVEVRGGGVDLRTRTDATGRYAFVSLVAGRYEVRISANGFQPIQKRNFAIGEATVFDTQLTIQVKRHEVNVDDEFDRVTAAPGSNGAAVVMRTRQIAALSDDPDELALLLQALAGPAPGPNGGEMFVDGFSGANLPPKSAIREVRINANPFSPEYDRPGFARIEIFTKPGSDTFHGQVFAQYNGQLLNSRNPLLAQAERPPYRVRFYGFDLGGPLRTNRASFSLGGERRQIDENALVLATRLDASGKAVPVNQAIPAPQRRTTLHPRLDFALSRSHTLVLRYQDLRSDFDNLGVGGFNLPSRGYSERQTEGVWQVSETAALSPRAVAETRAQFRRATLRDRALNSSPALDVLGAFSAGGAPVGDLVTDSQSLELANTSSYVPRRHTFQWGGRVREYRERNRSQANFSGTFTFFTLGQYRGMLAGEPGAAPSQFSRNAGADVAKVSQTDIGLFLNDDWRVRSNLTVSLGLRYETQTNLGGRRDWAPRAALAWSLDRKTVLRTGAGIFYDRIPASVTLNALRYDGVHQLSYLIRNPDFFPMVPEPAALALSAQPQRLRPVFAGMQAPALYQGSVSIERQIARMSRVSVSWIHSRGIHLLNTRNINAPIADAYPFGDSSVRLLTESAGRSRQNQLVVNGTWSRGKFYLFGYYAWSYGKDDNEGEPANPYDLRAEWGPSVYGDLRHRAVIGATLPLPLRFTASPFFVANSGTPYNITTGLDPLETGFPAQRPSLSVGPCVGESMVEAPGFGCFNLVPGGTAIPHNYGLGPAAVNLVLRLARTWSFGREGASGRFEQPAGEHGGPPGAMPAAPAGGRRYNVTLSAMTLNALNHPNYAPPDGVLTSPWFGQPRSLGGIVVMSHGGGATSYNRKIDLQLRFTF